jgi:deoxycytidine triphosphate deaminase
MNDPKFGPNEVAVIDPEELKGIPPALLNSADITAYAEKLTPRLFEPFDIKGLKPATYEIPFEGDVYLWRNEKSLMEKISLERDQIFKIDANAIVYFYPKTYFRIPKFLALRFNLHIRLVHRGLLLGTGPLVDPGFAGRLLIPVHNLTSQSLIVRGSDGFIWVEVTKISPVRNGTAQEELEPKKKGRSAEDYLKSANNLNPIVSTLRVTSDELKIIWDRTQKIINIGGVGVAVALAALTYGCWSLLRDAHQYVTDTRKASVEDLEKLQKRQELQQLELDRLKKLIKEAPPKNGTKSSSN